MPFPFYRRLSKQGKATYRKSDAITEIALPDAASLRPLADAVRVALERDDRIAVEEACHALVATMGRALRVGPVSVRVLAKRPRSGWGELHGLYTREEAKRPVLQVWMRTAAHRNVVAYRTFLRTLLHEVGHHLDYELLRLDDSLHTEGFFRRESSLMRQLVPERARKAAPEAEPTAAEKAEKPERAKKPAKPVQTALPWG